MDNFLLFLIASDHQFLTKRIKLNFRLLFKLSYLNSNFALTLGFEQPDPGESWKLRPLN